MMKVLHAAMSSVGLGFVHISAVIDIGKDVGIARGQVSLSFYVRTTEGRMEINGIDEEDARKVLDGLNDEQRAAMMAAMIEAAR